MVTVLGMAKIVEFRYGKLMYELLQKDMMILS